MRQLFIVNSAKALNAKADNSGASVTPFDFSNLAKGAISFFELGASTCLDGSTAPLKNFAFAFGRSTGNIIFPEIDINSLSVTETEPSAGVKFSAVFTAPSATDKKEYTLIFVKKGVVPNERNKFTISVVANGTSASTLATAIANAINNKANKMFDMTATVSNAQVTVTCNNVGEHWGVIAADELAGTSITVTDAKPEIGGKSYMLDLASRCAAGKGYNLTSENVKELYPGYPEEIEDVVVPTSGYHIFNLRFATNRASGKQMDEKVWQYVHIAVPATNSDLTKFQTILGQPVLVNEPIPESD